MNPSTVFCLGYILYPKQVSFTLISHLKCLSKQIYSHFPLCSRALIPWHFPDWSLFIPPTLDTSPFTCIMVLPALSKHQIYLSYCCLRFFLRRKCMMCFQSYADTKKIPTGVKNHSYAVSWNSPSILWE